MSDAREIEVDSDACLRKRWIMRCFVLVFGGLIVLSAPGAAAEPQESGEPYLAQHLQAPSRALELKAGTGYTQGIGMLAPTRSISDASGAGLAVGIGVGARLSGFWSVGLETQYQEFVPAQNSAARGFAFDIGATYHFLPVLRGDPWVRLGTGYRLFYESDPTGRTAGTWTRHGFDLVAAKVGYDVRISETVAIGPVIGADFDLFVWEDPTNPPNHLMSSPQPASFVYAGLQGRFDLGGERTDVARAALPSQGMGVTAPQP